MSNVLKRKSPVSLSLEWTFKASKDTSFSGVFSFLDSKCHLQFSWDRTKADSGSYNLYFKSNEVLPFPFIAIVCVCRNSSTLIPKTQIIASTNQSIYNLSSRATGCLLTFEVIMHYDPCIERAFLFSFSKISDPCYRHKEQYTESHPKSETDTVSACKARKDISKSSKSGMNMHLEALSRDFSKLLEESSSFDVEITCEGKTFKSHKSVLETRSTVFSAMLKSDMVEGKTGLIKVEDIAASIFESFLRYLYSGTLPELSIDAAKQFYEASDKYAVEELKIACSEYLTKNLSIDTACDVLVLADQHSDENFRKSVIAYIVEKKIPRRDKQWPNFCKMHPILAIEVQNLYIQKHCPE